MGEKVGERLREREGERVGERVGDRPLTPHINPGTESVEQGEDDLKQVHYSDSLVKKSK